MLNLAKPEIQDIVLSEEDTEKIDKILKSKFMSDTKRNHIRNIVGGFCFICDKIPNKILKYKMEGITLVERYCNECFSRAKK